MKQKFRFVGRHDDMYIWESVYLAELNPNESRVEQIKCSVDWFWAK